MPDKQTFESIADDGRAIVDAHKRKKGFEEGIRSLLSELYPDNAHFIYELLQNAEDAHANVVEFELDNAFLEVHHNGSREFTLNDIDAITSIGNSTKKDDPTQIGKFGVGFKAVYSYTSRPEIRSGAYSFAIEDLFINERIGGDSRVGWTSFRFPFDRKEKPAKDAAIEVTRGLTALDEKTLLFLSHIRTVTYSLPDGTIGIIDRQDIDEQIIRIQKSQEDDFAESHWLRLVGKTSVDHDGPNPLFVAAAFQLGTGKPSKSKGGKQQDDGQLNDAPIWTVEPLDQGDVSIYFPAVKESSGLKFHIHAPFASTVARDSVRDDPGNEQLINDIGTLIADALPSLCSQGFINDKFLAALPNNEDQIGRLYQPLRNAIVQAFNELEITPARGSGYAPARSLVSSPGEFKNWLKEDDLPFFLDILGQDAEGSPRWIRERDSRPGRFLSQLGTIEFNWWQMNEVLDLARDIGDPDDLYVPKWLAWLATKSDSEISDLYQLLGIGYSRLDLFEDLASTPIVRLTRRGKVEHVKGPETYLPSSRSDNVQSRVQLELAYFDDDEDQTRAQNLRQFYTEAGVRRWDESARIEARLKAYKEHDRPVPDGDQISNHVEDVKAFAQFALANRESARRLFGNVPFLVSPMPEGTEVWTSPVETYIDLPYRATGLSSLYPSVLLESRGDSNYYRAPYPAAGYYLEISGFEDFLELAGSIGGIEITPCNVLSNPQMLREWWSKNRQSDYTINVDWDIKQLDKVIKSGDHRLLRTLWHAVVHADSSKSCAKYRANKSANSYPLESQLTQKLKSKAWIIDRKGDLRRPHEMTIENLPDDWERPGPNSLVHSISFGADVTRHRWKAKGFVKFLLEEGLEDDGLDTLHAIKEAGLSKSELYEYIRERAARQQFPELASTNPERRSWVAAQDALDAPSHQTESRLRSVVNGQTQAAAESKAYLRAQYTSDAGEMFCQSCRKPLPFRVEGNWYFESVRFVSARQQVHTANALALCPLCAALYKYARETRNDELLEALANTDVIEGQGCFEIPLVLDGKSTSLRFTGQHAIDLQAALHVAGDERK